MAYAVKYTSSFRDYLNRIVKIDIEELDYAGSSTAVKITDAYLEAPEIERYNPIFSMGLKFNIWQTEPFSFQDLLVSPEKHFRVKMYISNNLEFVGFIVPGVFEQPLNNEKNTVTIPASTGLKQLKNIQFSEYYTGATYYGKYLYMHQAIDLCLRATGLELDMVFNNSLIYDLIGTTNFYSTVKLHTDLFKEKNLYEVLEGLLFGFRLMQVSGKWYIERVNDMNLSSKTYKTYEGWNDAIISTSTVTPTKYDINTQFRIINNSTYNYQPAKKKITVNLETLKLDNFFNNDFANASTNAAWTKSVNLYPSIYNVNYNYNVTKKYASGIDLLNNAPYIVFQPNSVTDYDSDVNGISTTAIITYDEWPYNSDASIDLSYNLMIPSSIWGSDGILSFPGGAGTKSKASVVAGVKVAINTTDDDGWLYIVSKSNAPNIIVNGVAVGWPYTDLETTVIPSGSENVWMYTVLETNGPTSNIEDIGFKSSGDKDIDYQLSSGPYTSEGFKQHSFSWKIDNMYQMLVEYTKAKSVAVGKHFLIKVTFTFPIFNKEVWVTDNSIKTTDISQMFSLFAMGNVSIKYNSDGEIENVVEGFLDKNYIENIELTSYCFDVDSYNYSNAFLYDSPIPKLTANWWYDSKDTSRHYYIDRIIQDAFQLYSVHRRRLLIEMQPKSNLVLRLNDVFKENYIADDGLKYYYINGYKYNLITTKYNLILDEYDEDNNERISGYYY